MTDLSPSPLRVDKQDHVVTLTLDRPDRHNALTPELVCRLADALRDFQADDSLRVAIITGAGEKAFCAGGDLGRMLPLLTGDRAPEDDWDRRVLDEPAVMAASGLRDYPLHKPVIAAINGLCLAAGAEMILGADIRIAAAHATFGFPEPKRALLPFAGALVRLARQVPHACAMEMLLTGDPIDAREAHRIGLVNHVVDGAQVLGRAREIAQRIAGNGPLAVQRIKQTVLQTSGVALEDAYRIEDESRRVVLGSADAREGPRAFMEKRSPRYLGR